MRALSLRSSSTASSSACCSSFSLDVLLGRGKVFFLNNRSAVGASLASLSSSSSSLKGHGRWYSSAALRTATMEQQQKMNAIVVEQFGEPSVLQLKQVERPKITLSKQVLVKMEAVGVNPVETYIRSGVRGGPLPYTPGSDGAGVIVDVSEDVTSVKKGDRVYLSGSQSGTYAEYTLAKEDQVHHLPDNLTFSQGACINIPFATAYRSLFQLAKTKPGEFVFVHGASGGVGLASVQLARSHGATVVGTASTPEGRELVLKEGAHYVFNHREEGYLDQVKELAKKLGAGSGEGVEVLLEMLANVNLSNDLKIMGKRGRIIVVGSRGNIEISPRDMMSAESSVQGVMLGRASPTELKEIHSGLRAGFENGSLRPIVGKELALVDAPIAHHEIIHSSGARGNIVLLPSLASSSG
ncbi:Crystallin zeta [Balamuthia mandrillaris]